MGLWRHRSCFNGQWFQALMEEIYIDRHSKGRCLLYERKAFRLLLCLKDVLSSWLGPNERPGLSLETGLRATISHQVLLRSTLDDAVKRGTSEEVLAVQHKMETGENSKGIIEEG